MTQVIKKRAAQLAWLVLMLGAVFQTVYAQPDSVSATSAPRTETAAPAKPAETLYLQLRGVGLDPARTFHIRGASLDRAALHISLEDGDISFTSTVNGKITGAFFLGEGELLLTPPNRVERDSMGLFTGMAILEEHFSSAYLRFNDDTFEMLRPFFRPADDAQGFSSHWNETAHNLAEADALRLLATFSRWLPLEGKLASDSSFVTDPDDRLLHVRLQGDKLGTFDAYYDSTAPEQIWAGQTHNSEGVTYYDLWTSFEAGPSATRSEVPIRPDDVAISRYVIRAEIKPPTTLNAETSVQLDVRSGGGRALFFELSRFLQVKQVEADGKALEFINNTAIDGTQLARRGNDLVAVIFPEPLQTGQKLKLKFLYGGDVLSEAGGGLLYVGARGTWYPNRGLMMADFDLEFHYAPEWTLLATGKRVPEALGTDQSSALKFSPGDQVSHWVTERPSELAGFNLGKYERATAQANGVIVETYAARRMEKTFPQGSESIVTVPDLGRPLTKSEAILVAPPTPSPAHNAQAVADRAAHAVDFYAQRLGPFPYSSLKLTQMPGHTSQGWPGLVFLSSFAFLSREEEAGLHLDPMTGPLSRLMLTHEIAHQWWGDLVGWKTYRDQWIVEALANYCALMIVEKEDPEEFRKIMETYRGDLLKKNKQDEMLRDAGPVTLGQRLNSSHFPEGYEAISYGRGTWLFHMLRHMMLDSQKDGSRSALERPDEPFVRILRQVRERYAGKDISTQELLSMFEESFPKSLWYENRKSLDWFLDGWIQGAALPRFGLQSVKYTAGAHGTTITGVITQKDGPSDLVTSVPVYGVLAGKTTYLGRVFVDTAETPFRLNAPAGTKKIVLDPNQTLLTGNK